METYLLNPKHHPTANTPPTSLARQHTSAKAYAHTSRSLPPSCRDNRGSASCTFPYLQPSQRRQVSYGGASLKFQALYFELFYLPVGGSWLRAIGGCGVRWGGGQTSFYEVQDFERLPI